MTTKEIQFRNRNNLLFGTLTLPEGGAAIAMVLMVHGSGPLDRDENTKGFQLNVFNRLAEDFSHKGIASFRYDKAGCGKSEGNFFTTGFHALIEDACMAVDTLIPLTDGVPIFLLGHSEGTVIAPVVSKRKPQVTGLILLAPTIDRLETTLIKQAHRIAEAVSVESGIVGILKRLFLAAAGGAVQSQRRLIDRVKSSTKDSFYYWGSRIPARWLRELLAHELDTWMSTVAVPILTISGSKDIQCDPNDSKRIAQIVKSETEVHLLENLTHILRSDDQPASFARYAKLVDKPLDDRVIEIPIAWISKRAALSPAL